MANPDAQPRQTLRGTWDQILGHRDEIPGTSEVELRIFGSKAAVEPSIALLESWLAAAPTGHEAIREAEQDLLEFKRNMNLPRKEAGERLYYPDVG